MIDDREAFEAIITHGLSVRQIPHQVVSRYEMSHFIEGDTIVENELNSVHFDWFLSKNKDSPDHRFDHEAKRVFRKYAQRVKIPKNAGHWMCQQVRNTSSNVTWDSKEDNLAPTLNESVELFLKSLEG